MDTFGWCVSEVWVHKPVAEHLQGPILKWSLITSTCPRKKTPILHKRLNETCWLPPVGCLCHLLAALSLQPNLSGPSVLVCTPKTQNGQVLPTRSQTPPPGERAKRPTPNAQKMELSQLDFLPLPPEQRTRQNSDSQNIAHMKETSTRSLLTSSDDSQMISQYRWESCRNIIFAVESDWQLLFPRTSKQNLHSPHI